ncbi:MAG TPA: cupin domain-containing protein [Caulobacteraceae bacterium]|jgi:quercetin dioxygenase-like cupin family protein|nr:cupin domain-containing protein [Caulobacteraceae bacterium]
MKSVNLEASLYPEGLRMPQRSPYHISKDDIPAVDMAPPGDHLKGGALKAQMVFGTDTSMMFAARETGYHSTPHCHDAEQMNYVVEGSIWLFIGNVAILASKGDIVRIPRNAVHWSWVREPGGCVLLETHTPPLIGDDKMKNGAVSLLAPDEDRAKVTAVENIFTTSAGMEEIEAQAMAMAMGIATPV